MRVTSETNKARFGMMLSFIGIRVLSVEKEKKKDECEHVVETRLHDLVCPPEVAYPVMTTQ